MSKESKNRIVPKLRFPEFKKDGEWKEKKLGDCLLAHPDYGINAPAVPYSSHLPTYLRITDISEEGHFLARNKVSVEKEVSENNYLQRGDIVIARTGASVGKSYEYRTEDGELVFAGFLIRVRPDENKLNAELLFQYLSSQKYWSWVSFTSMRSGQPGINGNEYASLPIPLPKSLPEQQKIASCLSSLDGLITAENQKLEALKAHKKGLMQQLFPAEGEKVPRLRFAEFRDSGEWELLEIKNKVESISGYPFSGSNISEDNSGVPLLRGINITEGYIRHNIDIDRYFLGDVQNLKKFKLETNDLVIGMDGSKVGKNSALITNEDAGSLLIQRVARLRSKQDGIMQFIFQQINSNKFHSYVDKINTSGGIPHISLKQIESFETSFPRTIKEQQKIASCLSSLDELITSQAEKIEALKEHKKGLMQGLFPKG
jgi:type I restriction enzyme S subunit